MRYIADLHIHSKYSRACSKNLTLSNLAAWASAKGIDIIGTSDFTHPRWLKEIEEKLEPAEPGLFRLRKEFLAEDGDGSYEAAPKIRGARPVRFMLTTELSCIYKKNGRTRRLHLLVFFPSVASVKKLIVDLERRECNLASDGRPILGIDGKEILKMVLEIDPDGLVVPAHAWTPWFSVFGSESGFDSLEECFDELAPHIHAIETGLSSDPLMNRHLSRLDNVMLISNSDAHGLKNLGREASVFDLEEPSYGALTGVLRNRETSRFPFTIEFFPEEGKYHADGHRDCGYSCDPEQTVKCGGICPKCGKKLTRGVLGRVHALADREIKAMPKGAVGYKSIVPFEELLGEVLGVGRTSKRVAALYRDLLSKVGPEFHILLDAPVEEISLASSPRVADAVERMRAGNLVIRPGYDGVYGTVRIFEDKVRPSQEQLLI